MTSPRPLALPAAVKIRRLPTVSPSDRRKKCVCGFVVPSRWIVASDTTLSVFETTGNATDTSNRSPTPNVTNVVNWLTDAVIPFVVVTTS